MLQAIRDKVTGWIAYGIIFLISIPFALWGVNSYLGGGEAPPAATVNGEEITLQTLDQAYANYRQRLLQLFGGTLPETFADEQVIRQRVLDQLVEEYALRQYTQRQRYRVGNAELNRIIRNMDAFKRDGNFDSDIYQAQLRSLGYSPIGFEEELRRSRAIEQLQNGIRETAFVVPEIADEHGRLARQERALRSLRYPGSDQPVEVTDEAVEQRYQAFPQRYQIPEQIRIDYIEVSLDSVKEGVSVAPEEIRGRYEDNLSLYTTPEVREASHILLQADADNNDAVLARIREIRERIVAGEDFADLARELSEDPVSAAEGGSLGEIERGIMVEAFESALFALDVGQLSEPVRTSFGWHLIKLHGVSGGEVRPFEDVRAELEEEIRTERAESQIFDLVESLSNIAYEQPDSLAPAAEQLGLELRTSDWFDRSSGDGIAADRRVRAAAFAADVFDGGLNSEAIELDDDRVVFLRVKARKEASLRPLEEVADQIRQELRRSRQREANLKAGLEALEQLRQGLTLEELAQRWNADIEDHGLVARDATEPNAQMVERAFKMPRPETEPVYDGVMLADGQYAVLELSEIRVGEPEEPDQGTDQQLLSAAASADYQSVLKLITSRADVVRTPPEELEF